MKVSLNLKNRILTFAMLSNDRTASMADWKVINTAKETLGLSDEDHEKYKIKAEGSAVTWENKEEADKVIEYDIPQRVYEMISSELREQDSKGKLSHDQAALAECFLEG